MSTTTPTRHGNGKDRGSVGARSRVHVAFITALALVLSASAVRGDQQAGAITSVAVRRSTWMAMTVSVNYSSPASPESLTVAVAWRRMNGRPLKFTPVVRRAAPGAGVVDIETSYHGMLPPPTPMRMEIELSSPRGRIVLRRHCEMSLVNGRGKAAWAGDLVGKTANELAWKVTTCH